MLKFGRGFATPLAPRLLPAAAIGARGDWERELFHAEEIFSFVKIGTHRPCLPAPRYAHITIIVRPVYARLLKTRARKCNLFVFFPDLIIFQKGPFC